MTVAAAIYAVGWARFPAYRKFNDYFMFVSSLFHSPSPHSLSLAQHWKTECHFVRWCSLCVLTAQQIEATLYSHWMWRRKKTLMINLFVCLVACLLVSVSHLVQEFVSWHLVFSNFRVRMWMSEKKTRSIKRKPTPIIIHLFIVIAIIIVIIILWKGRGRNKNFGEAPELRVSWAFLQTC